MIQGSWPFTDLDVSVSSMFDRNRDDRDLCGRLYTKSVINANPGNVNKQKRPANKLQHRRSVRVPDHECVETPDQQLSPPTLTMTLHQHHQHVILGVLFYNVLTMGMYEYVMKISPVIDIYHSDPSTCALKTHMARFSEKEAALLVANVGCPVFHCIGVDDILI